MGADAPIVLVTGATGFVGRHLVPALRRGGWRVRPAARQLLPDPDAVRIATIGPDTDWRAALTGVDAVVHLAARVHHPGEENAAAMYHAINTEGTTRLAAAAQDAGVRDFIHLSTVLVNGSSTGSRAAFRESDTPHPRGVYGHSKAAAELGLAAIARAGAMRITVLRPPLIYGRGVGGNFALLVKAVRRGLPLPLASIDNRRSFIGVDNLVSFIQHRLNHPGAACETFLVADDERLSTPDFIRGIAAGCGRPARLVPCPTFILNALCIAGGRPEARDSLLGSLEINTSLARATGWQPRLTLIEGLKAALRPEHHRPE